MTWRPPPSLKRLCRAGLPLMLGASRGERAMATARAVIATDRWNSFDRWHETTRTMVRAYEQSGAEVQVVPIQTGGQLGSGRWVLQQAADVHAATLDVVSPKRQRIADFKKNPWHAVQWTAGTPVGGVEGELVIIDDVSALERLPAGGLRGKVLLSNANLRGSVARVAALGVAAVVMDSLAAKHPDAVAWNKLGWGGIPVRFGPVRLVAMSISQRQGQVLRRLAAATTPVRVRVAVDARAYVGMHDVVCAVIPGRDDPDDEVWATAHSAEPGAIDNASGVATTIEIAHILGGLIKSGALPRPRRSIRLLNAYECYGFFAYMEQVPRFQTPLAGVNIDTVGTRPEFCGGRLTWHATIPMSATFVDRIGEAILRAALRHNSAGYRLTPLPFFSTADTLMGDPKYGFPCPWLSTHRLEPGYYDAYHTSADVAALLSPAGLALGSAAMAAYLYYLADAATDDVGELATAEASHFAPLVRAAKTAPMGDYLREQHRVSQGRLRRWLWGGDRTAALWHLAECRRQVDGAGKPSVTKSIRARSAGADARVPRRTALLTATLENAPGPIADKIAGTGLRDWALYWADGQRSLAEIAAAVSCEMGAAVPVSKVSTFFEAHAELGYVELIEPAAMVTRQRLVRDLKSLGLRRGMDVMVHSSLSNIGHVVGGAGVVVDALLDVIGPRGTLFMPSFNHGVTRVFNPLATPTNNGAIPDAMWRRSDAIRSNHATHAVAAIGPKADEYCAQHAERGIFAPTSPITRLVQGGGYLLALGVTHESSTAYHVAEMAAPCGCLDTFGRPGWIVGADGKVAPVRSMAWRSQRCPVSPATIEPALDRRGLLRRGKVGHAEASLVKAIDLYRVHLGRLRRVCPTCPIKPMRYDAKGKRLT